MVTPLDSLNNDIDSLVFFRQDSFAVTTDYQGKLANLVDLALVSNTDLIPRIQEAHILAGHILCHLVDYILFTRHLSDE